MDAYSIRRKVLKMIYEAQSSHIGSNFSCTEILCVLYEKAKAEQIIVSKGWVAATVYALLAEQKYIKKKDIATYCRANSPYIGLLEPAIPGITCAGGSMGYGLPFGVGFALSQEENVYVVMSDGEQACGTTWESALIASHHKLDNLIVIIDYNRLQAMGETNHILKVAPLEQKWLTMGWEVRTVDGHNKKQIQLAIEYPRLYNDKPLCVIAQTIKGKGVSFMENNNLYHYKNLTKEEYKKAKSEL